MIRDYENIRRILREIYIYGCFTKDDFIVMGYSGRKIDKEQQRINAYLPDKFIKKRRVNKKSIQYCRYDFSESTKNYLAETYRNKSFTMLDIMSYFYILQILGDDKERTLPEILDELPYQNDEVEFTKDNLRIKLDELLESRFISSKKVGRNIKYALAADIWEGFSDEELLDIYTYLEFIKNVSPLEMPYYFLQRKLNLYLASYRHVKVEIKNPFQFKHNHIFNSLDNDILLECLKAIRDEVSVAIVKEGSKHIIHGLPIKVIHDSTYGRQYMLYFNTDYECINTIRVDKIRSITRVKKYSKKEKQVIESEKKFDEYCWCASTIPGEPQEVVIEFHFDEKKEKFIYQRIQREGHGGIVSRRDNGVYEYKICLRDPKEIIPWIRSFGERAKVISSGNYHIENTIHADWEKAVNKYEALP